MERMSGKTMNIVEDNIQKLKAIFPDVFNEEKVDFEKLESVLGNYKDDGIERYDFTWPGKRQTIKMARTPSTGTLRPCKEESKNWDTTENLYIEGDNLEVLKILQKSYYEKVKMIYIDPPYNTGTDILYKNDYSDPIKYYKKFTGQINDEKFSISTNTETNGRYHSNWLNMIYGVLSLARNLISRDGLLVIAIDDYEQSRLKVVCDEIFGEGNFIGTIVSRCNPQGRGKKNLDPVHEYHLLYCKDINLVDDLQIKKRGGEKKYKNLMRSGTNSRKVERPYRFYPILIKNNKISMIANDEYAQIYSKENGFNEIFISKLKDKYVKKGYKVIFPIAMNGEEKVWQRTFDRVLNEHKTYIYQGGQIKTPDLEYRTPISLWSEDIHSNVAYGTNILTNLFKGEKTFDYPKSIYTVRDFISLAPEGIVLDFFSGSCTTAHAVININEEEKTNRKFIMVQLPAKINREINIGNKRYETICDIARERIRRAGEKIKEENKDKEGIEDLDIGFKVFKLDSSNINKWDDNYSKSLEESLLLNIDNIKAGREEEDILYEVLLKYGIDLNAEINEHNILGKKVYDIAEEIVLCLEDDINLEHIEAIGKLKESFDVENCRAVFMDSGFRDDVVKTNAIQVLKRYGIEDVKTI